MPKGKNKKYCDNCKRYTNKTHMYKGELLCTRCFNSISNDNFCKKSKIKSMTEFLGLFNLKRKFKK